jgi:ribosomal protein L37AE/L43A
MDSRQYPTWKSVGLSKNFVSTIFNADNRWLDFLVQMKVNKHRIRSQFRYTCQNCGKKKTIHRIYEDYSICDKCSSTLISCQPAWTFIKSDDLTRYSDNCDEYVASIISKMQLNYRTYFEEEHPTDFMNFYSKVIGNETLFCAKFICGSESIAAQPGKAIIKAAVLCPFIWDDVFDWKNGYRRDDEMESHITPIIMQMHKWRGVNSSSNVDKIWDNNV